jgi:UDP-N-acetylmuramyl pentapeptide phosphotransferase/UDP-N-acetylglucosamine-1-phosphate transferase
MKANTDSQSSTGDDIQVLLTLYQSNRNNQELYIKLQRRDIYYAISLYCAIYSVFTALSKYAISMNTSYQTLPFYIMGSIVFVFSTVLICIHECALCETRKADTNFRKKKKLEAIEKIFGKSDSSKSKSVFYIILIFNLLSWVALLLAINYFT